MRLLPLWARVLLTVDGYARRGFRAYEVIRDELLLGRLDPRLHGVLTERAYANDRTAYLPGGARFQAGLFDWETTVLERMHLPPGAAILLAAAGGGRELATLLERGYEVVAFEPNEALLEGARAVSAEAGGKQVVRASLEDLVESAMLGTGPLVGVQGPFEMVLLGWASFSHLTDVATQVGVLQAIRKLFPEAVVVASFLVRGDVATDQPRRSVRAVRRVLRALGGGRVNPALAYLPRAGVVYRFSPNEIGQIARESGFAVRLLDTTRDGYAILEPLPVEVGST
ncbi:MAG TPA: hypothetical protein VHC69_24620 [Polyangiaceae bacterium]|nr:hypothetical protein [Polyangiaceae bacterium]